MKIWKYKRLSECSNFVSERTSNIAIDNYISTENMIENCGGVKEAAALPDVKSTSAYKPNDILLSNIRPYFCKIWFADKKGSCSNDVLVVRAKKEVDPKFLYYVLSDQNFFNWDSMTSKGTKMPRGTPNAIMKYSVPDLPLPTQQKIASILSAYDNLIQNYKKQIEALQTAASELYKEWFVRFRFPGWQNAEFENGIPEGWKIERLTKLVGIKYGKDHSKLDDGNIPVYGSGGIMRYCNKALYDKETVLIPRKGSLNNIMYANRPLWTVDTMFYSIMLRKNFAKYLYYVLSKIDMESFNAGAALPSMTTEILSHFKIIVPDNKTLELFDNKIALIFTQIDNLQQQIANLTQQRDLLLPRLMSGKLEVK